MANSLTRNASFWDRLLIHLLRQARSGLAHNAERTRIGRDWDGWRNALESDAPEGVPPGGYRLWREKDGVWLTNLAPPGGFQGYEESYFGHAKYARTLSAAERRRLEKRGNALATPLIEWVT